MSRSLHVTTSTLAILAAVALTSGPARAQSSDEKLSMPNVSIEGERQTPDIFFVFPTGKGGNVSAPRYRDYGPDILAPVVKPWFERDTMVNPVTAHVTSEDKIDLDEALKAPPVSGPEGAAPVVAEPQAPPSAFSPRSEPSIPSSARSLPSGAEPSMPSAARSLPSSAAPGTLGAPSSQPSIPAAARALPSSPAPSTLAFPSSSSSEASIPSSARSLPSTPRSSSTLAFPPSSPPASTPSRPGGYDSMHDPADGYVPPPS